MDDIIQEALEKGVKLHAAGQLDLAAQLYEAALKLKPNHREANHHMGRLKIDQGKQLEALQYLKAALQGNEDKFEFWLFYIRALIAVNRTRDARETLKQAKEKGFASDALVELDAELNGLTKTDETTQTEPLASDKPQAEENKQEPPQETVDELITQYNNGDFFRVLKKTKTLVQQYPTAFIFWHIQGTINIRLGELSDAEKAFRTVTELNPFFEDGFRNLGVSLEGQGKLDEAIDAYQRAIEIKPDSFETYYNLGNAQKTNGRVQEAIEAFNMALSLNPDYFEAYLNLGSMLHEHDRFAEAISAYNKALSLQPDDPEVYIYMANSLKEQGKLDEAIEFYQKTISLEPSYIDAHNNMGVALSEQGKLDDAILAYKKALSMAPDYADAYINLSIALKSQGFLDDAVKACKQALSIRPDDADAYNNMGNVLKDQGKLEEALKVYDKALLLKPDYAQVYVNIGAARMQLDQLGLAIEAFNKAISIHPYAEAYNNLGAALLKQDKLDEAIKACNKALSIKPDFAMARSQKLHLLAQICDWQSIAEDDYGVEKLGVTQKCIQPFSLLSLEDSPERHHARSVVYTREMFPQKTFALPKKPDQKPQRLRIGYFSSDFKDHPVTYLISNVVESHNREQFEVFGYSLCEPEMQTMGERLAKSVDTFRDVHTLHDAEIAKISHEDKIDIAIDLTGYTQNSRSGVFSYGLAPIQINYLGYPGSMGANFMDYIIADHNLIPEEYQQYYSEKPIYLPHHYQAQNDQLRIAPETPSRASLGLPEKGFVFCALNSTYKITAREFDIWMRLLRNVDGSVLWLLKSNQWAEANLLKEAFSRGVDAERLIFAENVTHDKYLAQFRQADLYLDTFNYNAGATASHALWAGLPVLTKQGKSYTARMASSLLKSIGLPELCTLSELEYETLALELAQNPEQLETINQKLSINRSTMPLFNTKLFTKHLENGYQQAYQRYFDGAQPAPIVVPD